MPEQGPPILRQPGPEDRNGPPPVDSVTVTTVFGAVSDTIRPLGPNGKGKMVSAVLGRYISIVPPTTLTNITDALEMQQVVRQDQGTSIADSPRPRRIRARHINEGEREINALRRVNELLGEHTVEDNPNALGTAMTTLVTDHLAAVPDSTLTSMQDALIEEQIRRHTSRE